MLPDKPTYAKQSSPPDALRRATDAKPFSGTERRRNPSGPFDLPDGGEVSLFHELGKALTSSLQLDQVLRTIMEKINEVLRPDTWSLLLMDLDKQRALLPDRHRQGLRRAEGRPYQSGAGTCGMGCSVR